jgi:hypothetical protein
LEPEGRHLRSILGGFPGKLRLKVKSEEKGGKKGKKEGKTSIFSIFLRDLVSEASHPAGFFVWFFIFKGCLLLELGVL